MMPLHPFEALVKSSKPSPINQARVSQNCLQAQLIKQWAEHAKVI